MEGEDKGKWTYFFELSAQNYDLDSSNRTWIQRISSIHCNKWNQLQNLDVGQYLESKPKVDSRLCYKS